MSRVKLKMRKRTSLLKLLLTIIMDVSDIDSNNKQMHWFESKSGVFCSRFSDRPTTRGTVSYLPNVAPEIKLIYKEEKEIKNLAVDFLDNCQVSSSIRGLKSVT